MYVILFSVWQLVTDGLMTHFFKMYHNAVFCKMFYTILGFAFPARWNYVQPDLFCKSPTQIAAIDFKL